MFKESGKSPQLNMFSSPSGMLRGSSLKDYLKNDSWHNIFLEHVVARVNEDIFMVLYSSDNGTPNAPVSHWKSGVLRRETGNIITSRLKTSARPCSGKSSGTFPSRRNGSETMLRLPSSSSVSTVITARHATARLPPTGYGALPGDVDKLQENTETRDANK